MRYISSDIYYFRLSIENAMLLTYRNQQCWKTVFNHDVQMTQPYHKYLGKYYFSLFFIFQDQKHRPIEKIELIRLFPHLALWHVVHSEYSIKICLVLLMKTSVFIISTFAFFSFDESFLIFSVNFSDSVYFYDLCMKFQEWVTKNKRRGAKAVLLCLLI